MNGGGWFYNEPLFYEDAPLPILPTPSTFSNFVHPLPPPHPFTLPCHLQPPKLTILSVVLSLVLFLWLNG